MSTSQTHVSATRLRIGIVLFVLWWLPVYLAVPAVAAILGDSDKAGADKHIAIVIIALQSIIGVIGLLLVGKQLAITLKRVKYRQLPGTVWKILWTGDGEVQETTVPKKKNKGTGSSYPGALQKIPTEEADITAKNPTAKQARTTATQMAIGFPSLALTALVVAIRATTRQATDNKNDGRTTP